MKKPRRVDVRHQESNMMSKKFIAYVLAEVTWKIVLLSALWIFHKDFVNVGHTGWWFLMLIVITSGFTEIGYIGGQAWLDRYVRVAELALDREDKKDESED